MAVDKNGQVYFTFEEIEERITRLNKFFDFVNEKSRLNTDYNLGIKSFHRWDRICKLKGFVWSETDRLLKEAMLKRVSFK